MNRYVCQSCERAWDSARPNYCPYCGTDKKPILAGVTVDKMTTEQDDLIANVAKLIKAIETMGAHPSWTKDSIDCHHKKIYVLKDTTEDLDKRVKKLEGMLCDAMIFLKKRLEAGGVI